MMIETPWPHMIIDDIYPDEYLQPMICEIKTEITKLLQNATLLTQKKTIVVDETTPEFANTYRCLKDNEQKLDVMNLFKEHRTLENTSWRHELNILIGEFDYPIHDESPRKILSLVTYLLPAIGGTGTILYDVNKETPTEVEWKQNRALLFAGMIGKTWHSYYSNPKMIRATVNSFLINK